jgi:dTDP-4-dehydrorhamnose 3,5-epimerase|tara:strand:- start:138 stop:548 length:411 start_codon:yes stop_codon:yes gene_type:complete
MTVKSIKFVKNKIISNKKGDIIKFINKNSKNFTKFGEIYFSEVKINKTKGWNIHYKHQCILAVPFGKIIFSFFNSKSKIKKITIDKKNNYSIIIPPGIWFSFKSLSKLSIVTNVLNNIHNSKETGKSNIINGIKIK